MIGTKTVLAIIPARGGSKGVPRKNIREVAGKPLIAWTIEAARKSVYIDRLILSSDDAEIIRVAGEWGCEAPFVRPAELARDDTPGIDPVLHALGALPEKYDYVVLLQPTSPLRSAADIDGCIERCFRAAADSCVAVTVPDKSPFWMFTLDDQAKMRPLLETPGQFTRRQALPAVYALNGAVYVSRTEWLAAARAFVAEGTLAHIMPAERSLDIDDETDLLLAGLLLSRPARHS